MITYFIVLAPHDNEQSDMVHKLALKPEIEKLALHQFVPRFLSSLSLFSPSFFFVSETTESDLLLRSFVLRSQRSRQELYRQRAHAMVFDGSSVRRDHASFVGLLSSYSFFAEHEGRRAMGGAAQEGHRTRTFKVSFLLRPLRLVLVASP